jgi:cyclophilin family peptidyl-prolyl cis-trans isomerase/HEAT repeat protein
MKKLLCLCLGLTLAVSSSLTAQRFVQENALAAIAILEDERAIDTTAVGGWVRSPDPTVRLRTAYMIGIVGDPIYLPCLQGLLQDKSREVLAQAIFAAGQLADTTSTRLLIRYAADGDSAIKAHAIEALSKIGSAEASQQLTGILSDSMESPWFRALAAESIHRLKDGESLRALQAQASNANDGIRGGGHYSMSRRAELSLRPAFAQGLNDSLEQIQIYSLIGASRINDTASVAALAPLLQAGSWRIKYYALVAIGKLRIRGLAEQVCKLLKANQHVYVRQQAIRVLGDIGQLREASLLGPFVKSSNVNLRCEVLPALAKLKGNETLPSIKAFAASSNQRERIAAAAAAGVLQPPAVSILEQLSADSVAAVRVASLEVLLEVADTSIVNKYVGLALADHDPVPVALACAKIGGAKALLFLPMMCAQYTRSDGSSTTDIKSAILDAMIEFGDLLPKADYVKDLAQSAQKDSTFGIRARGARIATFLGIEAQVVEDHYPTEITTANYPQFYQRFAKNPVAVINTSKGEIQIELYYHAAPKTVVNFVKLATSGFYSNRVWHRVIPDFVIQDGCPRGDGWGGPGYEIRCEYNDLPYLKGSVGMATSGKDTGGSQYFICQSPQPHLNGRYTLFGQVIAGMDVVERIEVGDTVRSIMITGTGE